MRVLVSITLYSSVSYLLEIYQVFNKRGVFDRKLRQIYASEAGDLRCHNIQSLNSWKNI
jgi:hypothetical protein